MVTEADHSAISLVASLQLLDFVKMKIGRALGFNQGFWFSTKKKNIKVFDEFSHLDCDKTR